MTTKRTSYGLAGITKCWHAKAILSTRMFYKPTVFLSHIIASTLSHKFFCTLTCFWRGNRRQLGWTKKGRFLVTETYKENITKRSRRFVLFHAFIRQSFCSARMEPWQPCPNGNDWKMPKGNWSHISGSNEI